MGKIKVLPKKILPTRLPVLSTAVAYLYLDYYKAPGWVWGMLITLFAILWIAVIKRIAQEEEIDMKGKL